MLRGRAITALKEGATPLNYFPLYGGSFSLSLQQVLHGAELNYPVSSIIRGYWVDKYLTLEEFLVNVEYPQWIEKGVILSYAHGGDSYLTVRELFVVGDILYMRVMAVIDCYGAPSLAFKASSGLKTLPVGLVNYLELDGGERWRVSF